MSEGETCSFFNTVWKWASSLCSALEVRVDTTQNGDFEKLDGSDVLVNDDGMQFGVEEAEQENDHEGREEDQ